MYPLWIRPDGSTLNELQAREALQEFQIDPQGIIADNKDEFVHVLSLLFASPKARQVVRAILAQSGSGLPAF